MPLWLQRLLQSAEQAPGNEIASDAPDKIEETTQSTCDVSDVPDETEETTQSSGTESDSEVTVVTRDSSHGMYSRALRRKIQPPDRLMRVQVRDELV